MKTLLIGNFGDQNLGDELILCAALQDYPNAMVMTSDSGFSTRFTGVPFKTRPFPPTGLRSWLRFFTNTDYRAAIQDLESYPFQRIVFAGGGLFAIKWRACFLWWKVFQFIKKNHTQVEIRFEHQGIDQNLSFFSRRLLKQVFQQADFISVRDESSGEALSKLGIADYEITTDRVWRFLAAGKGGKLKGREKLVLVNALSGFDIEPIKKKYPSHRIVFVPFAITDMKAVLDDFRYEVIFPQTKTELFDLLAQAEVLIGERFHSIVCGAHFCGTTNTFTLRAPYSEKVGSFCKEQSIQIFKN